MAEGEPTPARGLLVDKPAGVTSHDVVAEIRRERGGKIGHAGTLDPFATGLLVVLLGRATRLQRYLLELPKTYRATARLGWRSSTGDPDGELTETGRIPDRLELPTGEIEQRVPMTSAVKVDGERLYRKAHRGESVETPTRRVERPPSRADRERRRARDLRDRVLVGHLHPDAGGDARGRLLRVAAADGDRRPAGAGRRPRRGLRRGADGFLPERLLDDDEADRVGHGRPVRSRSTCPRGRPAHTRGEADRGRARGWRESATRGRSGLRNGLAMRLVDFLA